MDLSELKWRARKAFEYADTDQIGSLTKYQFKVAMVAIFGNLPDKFEAKRAVESCVDKRIIYDEFESWVIKKCSSHPLTMDLELLFSLLDTECKGYLTLNDLCNAAQLAKLRITNAVWQKVFYSLDKHKKGYIDLYEFLQLSSNTTHRH